MLTIEGPIDPGWIIRGFLIKENAFVIHYGHGHQVKVAHTKGIWQFAKLEGEKLIECWATQDEGSGELFDFNSTDVLDSTKRLVRYIFDYHRPRDEQDWKFKREKLARPLEDILKVWGGEYSKIERIILYQNGRNSYSDNGVLFLEVDPFKV